MSLERRTPLKRGPYRPKEPGRYIVCAREGCERQVYRRASDLRKGARYCSRECFNLDQVGNSTPARREMGRRQAKERHGAGNPNFRHGRRAGVNGDGGRRWYAALGTRCAAPECPEREPTRGLALHHCIYRQAVEREGGDVWDPRNALTLCDSCHASHHGRGRVLPLTALPDSVYEFAVELLGPGRTYEYLRRRYAGGDPRLSALLDVGLCPRAI